MYIGLTHSFTRDTRDKRSARLLFSENLENLPYNTYKIEVLAVSYFDELLAEIDGPFTKAGDRICSLGWAEDVFGEKLCKLNPEEKEIFINKLANRCSSYKHHQVSLSKRLVGFINSKPNKETMDFVNWKHGVYTNYSNNKNDGRNNDSCLVF